MLFAPKRLCAFVVLATLCTGNSFSEGMDETSPPWLTVTKDVAFLFPAYAINLSAHEGGHALLARVFDEDVEFSLRFGRIGLLEGYVSYADEKVPGWYRPLIAGAGTSFNLGTAFLSDWALQTGAIPYHLQPLFSQVYLYGQLDFASNLTNAFITDIAQGFPNKDTSNDFHSLVYFLSWDKSISSKYILYAGLYAVLALDLYLSWDRIQRNGAVLLGEPS